MYTYTLIQSFIFMFLFTSIAGADIITLKSGKVVKGKVVERTDDAIKVDQGIGVNLTYYLSDIESQVKEMIPAPDTVESQVKSSSKDFEREHLSVDEFFRLRTLFETRQFVELDIALRNYQKKFEQNHVKEDMIIDAMEIFDSDRKGDESLFEEWQKNMPESAMSHLAMAQYYFSFGWRVRGQGSASTITASQSLMMHAYFEMAIREIKKALDINPNLLPAYMIAINQYTTEGDENAGPAIEDALSLAPDSFMLRRLIMRRLAPRWGGSHEIMEEFAKDADQYLEDNPNLKTLRGYIYMDWADEAINKINLYKEVNEYSDKEKLKIDEAIKWYTKAINLGENTNFYESRAKMYGVLGNTAAQLQDLKRAIELCPINEMAYIGYSQFYFRKKDHKQALDYVTFADRLGFNSLDLIHWRGVASGILSAQASLNQLAGDGVEAMRKMNYALDYNPDSAEGHFAVGKIYLEQGKEDEAIEAFERAIKSKPNLYVAYPQLGYLYLKRNKLQESLGYYNKAIELKPADANSIFNRGRIHHNLGDDIKAEADAKKACSLGQAQACQVAEGFAKNK